MITEQPVFVYAATFQYQDSVLHTERAAPAVFTDVIRWSGGDNPMNLAIWAARLEVEAKNTLILSLRGQKERNKEEEKTHILETADCSIKSPHRPFHGQGDREERSGGHWLPAGPFQTLTDSGAFEKHSQAAEPLQTLTGS